MGAGRVRRRFVGLAAVVASFAGVFAIHASQQSSVRLPDVADARYGPADRNTVDLWKARSR